MRIDDKIRFRPFLFAGMYFQLDYIFKYINTRTLPKFDTSFLCIRVKLIIFVSGIIINLIYSCNRFKSQFSFAIK